MHCLICPKCCELEVNEDKVVGAGCRRGEGFARQELVMPKRVITTTIWCDTISDRLKIPVKTCEAIPLADIRLVMRDIRSIVIKSKPYVGQILNDIVRYSLEVTCDGQ